MPIGSGKKDDEAMRIRLKRCQNSRCLRGVLLFFILVSTGMGNAPLEAETYKNTLTLKAEAEPLSGILSEVKRQCGVAVDGLEDRSEESVTFSAENEPTEKAMKRLLRQLNEMNYAFVYSRTGLRSVSVFPKSTAAEPAQPRQPSQEAETGSVVQVVKVNPGTQAETLDLRNNDIVLEYDGVRMQSAPQLVEAVKQKTPEDRVEMMVVRDKTPFRVVLNGGFIGINIRTVNVPIHELGQ